MYPAHLGPEFYKIYKEEIVAVRLAEKAKPKTERDVAIIEGFKEAANATFGSSNSQYSWLYDPQYLLETTVNGQLLISMLVEDLVLNIPEAQLLQTNTDGATFRFKRIYLDKYHEICKTWEVITKLTLEFAEYKSMFIFDVNNYFCVKTDDSYKCKGRFEWEDFEKYKYDHLSKNKSHLIVAKAVFNYFVNGILPEVYLKNNRNIFDYCAFVRMKGDWELRQICIDKGEVVYTTLQKTLRYYVSKKGCKIIKHNTKDGREMQIEAGKWLLTEYNYAKQIPWDEYGVDDKYYLEKIYEEIATLVPPASSQLSLSF